MARRSTTAEDETDGTVILYGPDGDEYRTRTLPEATRMRTRGYSETPPGESAPEPAEDAVPEPIVLCDPDGDEYRTTSAAEAARLRVRGYRDTSPDVDEAPIDTPDPEPVDTSGALPNPED